MIREAAYMLYERHASIHGHDLDDWLAAEAYVDRMLAERRDEAPEPPWLELQHGGGLSIARGEALKRIVRQHPQRAIPQVESVEPREAPSRE
jgi:hypothetical protein